MRAAVATVIWMLMTGSAFAAPAPVVVFLERDGHVVDTDEGAVTIPRFGGGDRVWTGIVGCVQDHFAPFQVEIVDRRPAQGEFITAVIGGRASQLGLDDESTNGVGPYDGNVLRSATVHVFSQVSGERDVGNLCAVTAHEVGHALGLDHSTTCGDIMSYHLDACGTRRFLDVEAPCGEGRPRTCGNGDDTQSSFGRLGALLGFKSAPAPASDDVEDVDPWDGTAWVSPDELDDPDELGEPDEVDELDESDELDEVEPAPASPEVDAPAQHQRCGEPRAPRTGRARAGRGHGRWRRW